MNERVRFRPPRGALLALEPHAFDELFDVGLEHEGADVDADGVAVVTVRGPLEHHVSWLWDSYDAIAARVRAAFEAEGSRAVVMRFDSPGGLAAGATECHREIRKLRKRYGKPLFAYADEMACSAAYELASAADEVWLPDTASVGSVGVILAMYDTTGANKKAGVRVELVTSGTKKADPHPERPMTDEIRARAQDRVDYMAGIFFGVVAKARGVSVPKIAGLQAGVYQGNRAVKAGLADGVAGWDAFLAHVKDQIMGKTSTSKNDAKPAAKGASKKDAELARILGSLLAQAEDPKALIASLSAPTPARADMRKPEAESEEEEEEAESEEEEEEESSDDSEEEGEEEEEDDDESTDGSTSSTSSTSAEEEEKALLTAKTGIYQYSRLFRACQEATGQRGVKAVFGAISALGQQRKSMAKQSVRLEKLERENRASKVDAMISKAKRDGKITRAMVENFRAIGLKDPKVLRGYLAALPKLARTKDEELVPRTDANGNPVAAMSDEQSKILANGVIGLSEEERKIFAQEFQRVSAQKTNGAARRH